MSFSWTIWFIKFLINKRPPGYYSFSVQLSDIKQTNKNHPSKYHQTENIKESSNYLPKKKKNRPTSLYI
ncbi:hypothetical protein G210_3144 [Candida maltosa Xu316]|uniref:Uncharacterized protein n=1 Tax=Candida maltosa (strain Xu316) TaxID=1245528 RepID=M3IJR6_CANMX|nr:hypothetical protein G210_3144 [Candida maltosa Xu316]